MSLINSLESKLGHFAIPGLVQIMACFQAAVWLMVLVQREFINFLVLDRDLVLAGQVWRLITWAFIPITFSPIFLLFAVLIMFMIGRSLDSTWGAFRVNLYFFGGMFFMIMATMIFGAVPAGLTLYTGLFLAFATLFPNFEFMLFFILPVKVKYLGMLMGGFLLLDFINRPEMRFAIIASILNYLIAFLPGFIKGMNQKAVVANRRAKFESAKHPEQTHFYKCAACGKTDLDDPKQEFRVAEDGEEYCVGCLPNKPKLTAGSSGLS